jgi:hypothetical protein
MRHQSNTSSARDERWGNSQAERPGGIEVDRKLELSWLHHGQIAGFLALQNTADV